MTSCAAAERRDEAENVAQRRLASNNIRTLEGLNAGHDFNQPTYRQRASGRRPSTPPTPETSDRGTPPTSPLPHARSPWDELRVWDPDD